jgi:hypothetical protein
MSHSEKIQVQRIDLHSDAAIGPKEGFYYNLAIFGRVREAHGLKWRQGRLFTMIRLFQNIA